MGLLPTLVPTASRLVLQFGGRTANTTTRLSGESSHWLLGLVVALTLIALLALLSVVTTRPEENRRVRALLLAALVPLFVAFAAHLLQESLQVVGF